VKQVVVQMQVLMKLPFQVVMEVLGYVNATCSYQTDGDLSQNVCDCVEGAGYWNLGGEVSATACCDDAGDNRITESGDTDAPSIYTDGITTCCDTATDCTYDDTCYATTTTTGVAKPNDGYCNAGTWQGGDDSSTACTAIVGAGSWSLGGDTAATACCGDDNSESIITETGDVDAPAGFNDSITTCCDVGTDCTYDDTCYADTGVTGTIPSRAYCDAGSWVGGDTGNTECTAIVAAGRWSLGGETAAASCCGDDNNENMITESGNTDAPAGFDDAITSCCSDASDCTYDDTCFANATDAGLAIPNNAFCLNAVWQGGDDSSTACSGIVGAGYWSLGGDTAATLCCGDDNNENRITETSGSDSPAGYNDAITACCDTATDCNYNDGCYATTTTSGLGVPNNAYCNSGTWEGGDAGNTQCDAVAGTARWNLGGETAAAACCGDDNSEVRINETSGTDAPAGYNDGITTCCDTATDCTYDDTCYADAAVSAPAAPNRAYCNAGTWIGGDASSTACTNVVGAGAWLADGVGQNCCGDDTSADDFEQSTGAGRSACIDGSEVADGTVFSTNFLVSDGQVYSCKNSTFFGFDTDLDETSCSLIEGYYCNADGTWQTTKPNGCSCTLGDDCTDNLCIEGFCRAGCDSFTNNSRCSDSGDVYTGANAGVCVYNASVPLYYCDDDEVADDDATANVALVADCALADYTDQCDDDADGLFGYQVEGVCGATSNQVCLTAWAADPNNDASSPTVGTSASTEAAVCVLGNDAYYCDDVSDGDWTPGNQRCDGSDTQCRICNLGTGEDDENLCETGCGADASSDEKTADACDGASGWIDSTCTYYNDGDSNQDTCDCREGVGYWNLGGEVSATTCCDDGGENQITESADPDAVAGYNDGITTCCDTATDCTYDDTCFADASTNGAIPSRVYCNAGTWQGGDDDSSACGGIVGSGFWSLGGNTAAADCCGDDNSENRINETGGTDSPAGYDDGITTCCDTASACTYDDTCYNDGTLSAAAIPNKAYCNAGTWEGGDTSNARCDSIVGSGFWSLAGEVAAASCCGDDSGENRINETGDTDAPSIYKDAITTCCDVSSDCTYDDTCYANASTTGLATPNNAFCLENVWQGGDDSSTACTGIVGAGYWSLGGATAQTNCCGDDNNENRITETGGTDAPSGYGDAITSCCNATTDCTYDDTCYADASTSSDAIPSKAYCNAGTWEGGDAGSTQCTAVVGAGSWSLGGETAAAACCGDDNSENIITEISGFDAPAGYNDAITACCDVATDCNYDDTCYADTASSGQAAPNNAYCDAGTWVGGDNTSTSCAGVGGTWLTNGAGQQCCGDDSTSDDFEQASGAGRSACLDGTEREDGYNTTNFVVSDGQVYSCGAAFAATYAFDDDHTGATCIAIEGYYCQHNGTWDVAIPSGCPVACTQGTECGSSLCVNGLCRDECNSTLTGLQCSDDGSNDWDNDGICARINGAWECDESEAAYHLSDHWNDCDKTAYGISCDSTSLNDGYSADGVCGGASYGTCYTNYAADSTANITASSTFGTQAAVCVLGNNADYCDDVSDGLWNPGNKRCDGSDTACRVCYSVNGTDSEGVCESGCGADASSDELSIEYCDGGSGYVNATCSYLTDGDVSANVCNCLEGAGFWNLGGDASATSCCDDVGDNRITETSGNDAPSGYNDAGTACCDAATDCNDDDTCYASGAASTNATPLRAYCSAGTWVGGDDSSAACIAIGETWLTDGVGQNCCGDDTTSDSFEQTSGAGRSICIEGSEVTDGTIFSTNFLVNDGQLISCENPGAYGFDTDVSGGDCTAYESYYCHADGNWKVYKPVGCPGFLGWTQIISPEGIFEPASGLLGTHVSLFSIRFVNLTMNSSDVLSCDIKTADGTILTKSMTGNELYLVNYSLNHTVTGSDSIINDATAGYLPWVLKNCTLNASGTILYSEAPNTRIYTHDAVYWADGEITRAVACAGTPGVYFNNTAKCEFSEDTMFALQMRNGNDVEESCFNNAGVSCSNAYCRGIYFPTCDPVEYFAGMSASIDDPNGFTEFTESFASYSVEVDYTRYVDSNGNFKLRIREPISSKTFSITLYNLTDVDEVNTNVYGAETGGGALAVTDNGDGTWNVAWNRLSTSFTGTLDFVFNVSFTDGAINDNRSLKMVVAFGVDNNQGAPPFFDAYFSTTGGVNTNDESDTSLWTTDTGGVCGDEVNNDFDYIGGTWSNSYDCFDPDCDGISGDDSQTNEFGSGKTGLCNYGTETNCNDEFDNDYDYVAGTDYTDCHDSDCFQIDVNCPATETTCNDGINNDWDYTIGNSDTSSNQKIENNDQKYTGTYDSDLTDCEDLDCDGQVGGAGGELCNWGYEINCSDGFDNDALELSDCNLNAVAGPTSTMTPAYAEYDCRDYCRATQQNTESGALCDDNLDNDWDAVYKTGYYNNQYTVNSTSGAGTDCRWGGYAGYGTNYNPDEDCDGETLSGGQTCELAVELTCNDGFDNDYDNDASGMPNAGWSADPAGYLAYFGTAYATDADYDDYDCAGSAPVNESINASWCFDGIDNDLDAYTWSGSWVLDASTGIDCEDPDCLGVTNPSNGDEICLSVEYNASDSFFTGLGYPGQYCDNSLDDDADGNTDCSDSDCFHQFTKCSQGPCFDREDVRWDSCANAGNDDYSEGIDCADSDCTSMIGSTTGALCTATESACYDGFDNDADSDVDCDDHADCDDALGGLINGTAVYCRASESTALDCYDGFDNDADGYTDCADPSCNSACSMTAIVGTNPISMPVYSGSISLNSVSTASVLQSTRRTRLGENFSISFRMTGSSSDAQWTIGTASGAQFDKTKFDVGSAILTGADAASFTITETANGFLVESNSASLPGGYDVTFNIESDTLMASTSFELTYAEATGAQTSLNNYINYHVVENTVPEAQLLEIVPAAGNMPYGGSVRLKANISDNNQLGACDWDVSGTASFNPSTSRFCTGSFTPTVEGAYTVGVTPVDYYSNRGTELTKGYTLNIVPVGVDAYVNKTEPFFNPLDSETLSFNASFNLVGSDNLGNCLLVARDSSGTETELTSFAASGNDCNVNNVVLTSLSDGVYSFFARVNETTDGDIIEGVSTVVAICRDSRNGVCGFADNDNNGNMDSCDQDLPPSVTLNSPIDNYYNDTVAPIDFTFSCSAIDEEVTNLALFMTNASNESFALYNNCTTSGTSATCEWNVTLQNGKYRWNCLGMDDINQTAWASSNWSIQIEYYPCATGDNCTSGVCIEGLCRDECHSGFEAQNCSIDSSPFANAGMCTKINTTDWECDYTESSYYALDYWNDCDKTVFGHQCDSNGLNDGYNANGVCGGVSNANCYTQYASSNISNIDINSAFGTEDIICALGNDGFYCDDVSDASWSPGYNRCDGSDLLCRTCDLGNGTDTEGRCESGCGADVSSDEKMANACDAALGWINSSCTYFNDGDSNQNTCDCIEGAGNWAIAGEVSPAVCCGDDAGENTITEAGDTDAPAGYADAITTCCDTASDCTYNDQCYANASNSIDAIPSKAYCNAGTWQGGDDGSTACNSIVGVAAWSLGGEISAAACCGDDAGEIIINETGGTDAPSGYGDLITTCCNAANDCTYDDTCYTDASTSSAAIPSKAYCDAGTWVGGDAGSTECIAIVGAGSWNAGGEVSATGCCGDDSGEFLVNESGDTDAPSGYDDAITTCCNVSTDCTYDDTCYDSGNVSLVAIPNRAYCNLGTWQGGDDSNTACNAVAGAGRWSLGGEVAAASCCGDDNSELVIYETGGFDAPAGYNDGIDTCCNSATDCTYDDTCYADTASSGQAAPNNAYCDAGTWVGGDNSSTACTGLSHDWLANGVGQQCCGDDSVSDDFEQTTGAGRSACLDGVERADAWMSTNFIVSDGQVYSCGSAATYAFDDDHTGATCLDIEGYYCQHNGTWNVAIPSGCPVACNDGGECGSSLCVNGLCRDDCNATLTGLQCSDDGVNLWNNDGICARINGVWECDESEASLHLGDHWNDCDKTDFGVQCTSGLLNVGYSADGICGGTSNANCYTNYASEASSNITVNSVFGTEAAVCSIGNNSRYCDDVSDAIWNPGNKRCDGSDTACRLCYLTNGTDAEGLCESGCGADAQTDELTPGTCDSGSGWVNSTCTYITDGDLGQYVCDCVYGTGNWSLGGEASPTTCCDDAGDNVIFETSGTDSPAGYNDGTTACCDAATDCHDDDTCYADGEVSITAVPNKAYCNAGTWLGGDNSAGVCTAVGGVWLTDGTGGTGSKCCGDDTTSDDFEQTTGAGRSACIDGSEVTDGTVFSGNFIVSDGQVYSCESAGTYAFDTDISGGNCTAYETYYCHADGNWKLYKPIGCPGALGWARLISPEGIFEPASGLLGTHFSEFSIKFENMTMNSTDVLECTIRTADGTLLIKNVTGVEISETNYTLNHTVTVGDSIINDASAGYLPWVLKNCTLDKSGTIIFSDEPNTRIYTHEAVYWADDEITRAVACAGTPGVYFNNTAKCEFSEDTMFALQMRNGNDVEATCFNNAGVSCSNAYCRGIYFPTCEPVEYFAGYDALSDDPNGYTVFTESFAGYSVDVAYTRYVDSNGNMKLRVTEPISNKAFSITLYNLSDVDEVNTNVYGAELGGGALAVTDNGDGTWNVAWNRLATPFTGTLDFVFNISFTDNSMNDNRTLKMVVAFGVDNNQGAPPLFDAYFSTTGGVNGNDESDTSLWTTDIGGVCGDEANNDFDYIGGTWSRSYDCFDPDCDGIQGDDSQTNEYGSGKTGLCNYGVELNCTDEFDNDYDYVAGTGYTDCHDSDCFQIDVACPATETTCNDGINNDWDYTRGNSDTSSNQKIENNDQKYTGTYDSDLTDCEDLDCDGLVGGAGGELCEWGYELNCNDGFDNDALELSDCNLNAVAGPTSTMTPAYAEYDCTSYCRANVDSSENGAECDDNIDNDWDALYKTGYYNNQYTVNSTSGAGTDCRWGGYAGYGTNYNPDEDCDGETLSGGQTCELAVELTCNDGFDNDYDNDASGMPNAGWSADPAAYLDYFGVAYATDADYDDYDCAGSAPVNESINASWCFDGIDNDLDAYIWSGSWVLDPSTGIDCEDPDCLGVINPGNPAETCLQVEYNASDSFFSDLSYPGQFCDNALDDDADGNSDCDDSDCFHQFTKCSQGPCFDREDVRWDSCSNAGNDDYSEGIDCVDSDCLGMIGSTTGALCTATETECYDGFDNDADSNADCADIDCTDRFAGRINNTAVYCRTSEASLADCYDGFDNDDDTYTDCADPSCNAFCGMTAIVGTNPISMPVYSGSISLNSVSTASVLQSTRRTRLGENFSISFRMTGSSSDAQWTIGTASGAQFDKTKFDVGSAILTGADAASFTITETANGFLVESNSASLPGGYDVTFNIESDTLMASTSFELTYAEATGAQTSLNNYINYHVVENTVPEAQLLEIVPAAGNMPYGGSVRLKANISDNNQLGACDWDVSGTASFNPSTSRFCTGTFTPTVEGAYTVGVTPVDYYSNRGTELTKGYTLNIVPVGVDAYVNKTTPLFNPDNGETLSFNASFNLVGTDTLGTCTIIARDSSGSETTLTSFAASGNDCNGNNIALTSLSDDVYSVFARVTETTDGDIIEGVSTVVAICRQSSIGVCGFADYDNNGNMDSCDIDTPPFVTLNTPAENYYYDSAASVNVTFNCSASDKALKNMGLYITNSANASFGLYNTCLLNNESSGSCSWDVTLTNGWYTWNCMAEDHLNQTAFATANRTARVDYSPCSTGLECGVGVCIDGKCKDECTATYAGMNCSNDGLNYLSSGMCTKVDASNWECDSTEAAFYSGDYWNDCSAVPEANECTSGSLATGYFRDGFCAGNTCCAGTYIDINGDALFNDNSSACTTCSATYTLKACSNDGFATWNGVCFNDGSGYDCINYTSDCDVSGTTIIGGTCGGSTWQDSYAEYSNLYNSTINRSFLYYITANETIFLDSVVRSSTINFSIIDNAAINGSHFINSRIYNSQICSGIFGKDVTIVDNVLSSGKVEFGGREYYAPTPLSQICAGAVVVARGTLTTDKEVLNDTTTLNVYYNSNNVIGYDVSLDASSFGAGTVNMLDDGTNGDITSEDGIYTAQFAVDTSSATGSRSMTATIVSIDDTWQLQKSVYVDNTAPTGSIDIQSMEGSDTEARSASIIASITYDDDYSVVGCRFANEDAAQLTNFAFESCSEENVWGLYDADGLRTVFLEIKDEAGNTMIYSDTIILNKSVLQDSTPPTPPVVLDDGAYTNSQDTLYFDWYNSSDRENGLLFVPLTYSYRLYNGTDYIYELNGTVETEATITGLNLTEGANYTLEVKSKNFVGLESSTASSNGIIVDLTAPSETNVTSSASGSWQDIDSVSFNFSASDSLSGLDSYSYSFDVDASTQPDNIPERKSSETFYNLGDGVYYLKVKAIDRAGNSGPVASETVLIDNTAPTIPQIYERELSYAQGVNEDLTYRWIESTDLSGITNYQIQIASDSEFENLVRDVLVNITSYKYDDAPTSGKYYARVRAQNGVGRWSAYSDVLKGEIDLVPPTVTLIKPRGKVISTYPVLVVNTNERATCKYRNGTDTFKLFDLTDSTHHEVILSLSNGVHSFDVECEDLVGNAAPRTTAVFTVDTSLIPDTLDIPDTAKTTYYSEEIMRINFTIKSGTTGVGEFGLSNLNVLLDSETIEPELISFTDYGDGEYTLAMNAPAVSSGTATHTIAIQSTLPLMSDTLTITVNELGVQTYCKDSQGNDVKCSPKNPNEGRSTDNFIVGYQERVSPLMLRGQEDSGTDHRLVSTLRYRTIVLRVYAPESLSTGVYYFDIRNAGTDTSGRKIIDLVFIEDPDQIDESSVWIIE
jgi:hypothetical protein